MIAFLIPLLTSLLPTLVGVAEEKFGSQANADKHAWVLEEIKAIVTRLSGELPSFLVPALPELEKLVADGIDVALEKLGI